MIQFSILLKFFFIPFSSEMDSCSNKVWFPVSLVSWEPNLFQRNQNSNFGFDFAEINLGRSYGESQQARLKQICGMGELMRTVCQIQVVREAIQI